jgi:hypothetical protein
MKQDNNQTRAKQRVDEIYACWMGAAKRTTKNNPRDHSRGKRTAELLSTGRILTLPRFDEWAAAGERR